jgi:mannose-1-phosphate guanylyltransferase
MIPRMNATSTFAFVMAGGSGERFWPMSRRSTPKHLLKLLGEETLLAATVRRLEGLVPLENTFILTNEAQLEATRAAVPFLPERNILAEPAKRDTAAACALATAVARSLDPDAVCVVLPADAMIHDVAKFRDRLADAIETASESGSIVTLSIPPSFPATGYGYLEVGAVRPAGARGSRIHALRRFVEKPDLEKATTYLSKGTFFWNAGIFVWKASVFLDEVHRQIPPLAHFIESLDSFESLPALLATRFATLPKISVDYAVMENARNIATVLADFDWDDVGAWTALPSHIPADAQGNSTRGEVVRHDAHGNIAISNGRLIALCGVKNLVVVETPDAILVCDRDSVQQVKNLQPLLPESLK